MHYLKLHKPTCLGLWVVGFFLLSAQAIQAQTDSLKNKKLVVPLNDSGTHYIQFSASTQIWMRHTDNNPGSTVFGNDEPHTTDISMRRLRLAVKGKVAEKAYVFLQIGDNNINYLSGQRVPIKILDAQVEYHFKEYLHFGAGKTGWTGLSRYSAPATTTVLGLDIPVFALATINLTDDFLRKLSVYAKGDVGQFNYRIIASKPYTAQTSSSFNSQILDQVATPANTSPAIQYSTYFKYQFFEKENLLSPYSPGTYFGKKKVLNVGFGFEQQNDFTWQTNAAGDTITNNMFLFAADIFGELPLYNGSVTFYGGYFNYDFGPNYIRNIGVNNPVNGIDNVDNILNGRGNAFPMIGSGNSFFGQVGYWLKTSTTAKSSWQPFFSVQVSDYQALQENMVKTEMGLNYYFNEENSSKLTFAVHNRPIFHNETRREIDRKMMAVLQYQLRF